MNHEVIASQENKVRPVLFPIVSHLARIGDPTIPMRPRTCCEQTSTKRLVNALMLFCSISESTWSPALNKAGGNCTADTRLPPRLT